MANEESEKIPPSFPSEPSSEGKKSPEQKIRTMKSDAEDLIRQGKESLVSIMTKQISAAPEATGEAKNTFKTFFSTHKRWFLIGIVGVVIIGTTFFFLQQPRKEMEKAQIVQEVIPPAFISMEKSRNLILKQKSFNEFDQNFSPIKNEPEREGIIKRIVFLVKDGEKERLGTIREFLGAASINLPETVFTNTTQPFNFFLYYQKAGIRRGLILTIENEVRAFRALLDQETTMRSAWSGFFEASDPKGTLAAFEDITYRNIDIRRLQLSDTNDLGLYYAIFKPKKYLLITTSLESMKTIINRVFDSL